MAKTHLTTTVVSELAWNQLTQMDSPSNSPVASTVAGVAPVQSWKETDQVLPDIGQVDNVLLAAAGLSNTILISTATAELLATITVSIGANGNWFVGATDTGVPARGTDESTIIRPSGIYGTTTVYRNGDNLIVGAGLMYGVKEGDKFYTLKTSAETSIVLSPSTTFVTIDRFGTVRSYDSSINLWLIPESQALLALVVDSGTGGNVYAVPTVHNAMLMATAVIPYSQQAITASQTATTQALLALQYSQQAEAAKNAAESAKLVTQADAAITTQNALLTEQHKNAAAASEQAAHNFADYADADRVATNADRAKVAADTQAVAADRAAVSTDASLSHGYKNEALASRNLAAEYAVKPEDSIISGTIADYSALHWAAKAQQWAQAVSSVLVWKGQWSATMGVSPPTPPLGNGAHFYRISGAGTIGGVDYAVGDYIHWDTIAKVWFKIDGTDAVVSVNGKSPIGGNVVLTSSDVGAASVNDVYPKDSTYTKQEVNELGWQRVEDLRGIPRTPLDFRDRSISAWFNDQGNPTSGWYSGINVRGWSDTYANWQLLSGSDLPANQSADTAKTALWFRTGSGAGWDEFQKVYTSKHKPTAAEIGGVARYRHGIGTNPLHVRTASHNRFESNVIGGPNFETSYGQMLHVTGGADTHFQLYSDYENKSLAFRSFNDDTADRIGSVPWNNIYHEAHKPTLSELGAAPNGYGLGSYGKPITTVLGDCELRRAAGFFQGAAIAGIPADGHPWKYIFSQPHNNPDGYFGYLALDFDLNSLWIGGQSAGASKVREVAMQGKRITAGSPIGNGYGEGALEVRGDGAPNLLKPTVGFHQPSVFGGSLSMWNDLDFRFHNVNLTNYAGIMVGLANVSDVYIRSDARLKTNFSEIKDALSKLKGVTGYFYDKKGTLKSTNYDKHEFGLIAQDVERVLPEAIHRHVDSNSDDGEEVLSISGSAISALIVEAVKELDSRLTAAGI